MKLSELQAIFQAGILAGEEREAAKAIKPPKSERETLFGVYINAYRARLGEFVSEDYPTLSLFLGEEAFNALVEDYIESRPSHHRNARWYSSHLPDFMRGSETWRHEKQAISMADFERALMDAFDASDAEALAIDALASFPSQRWPHLTFTFHPSLVLLELSLGTLEAYAALNADSSEEARIRQDGAETAAVWRSGRDPVYRRLEDDEYLAISEARAGCAFGDICHMAAFQQGEALTPERLAQFLVNWFEEGLVVTVRDDETEERP